MGDEIKLFNLYAKGRCRDKFLAMKHICGLSDLQYDIMVEKWCSGRVGMTRIEIADKHHVSERTLSIENTPMQERRSWPRSRNADRTDSRGRSSSAWMKRWTEWIGANIREVKTMDDLAVYLGFKKPEKKWWGKWFIVVHCGAKVITIVLPWNCQCFSKKVVSQP